MLDEQMNREQGEASAFDDRIIRALEICPNPDSLISDSFAARVAARVPAKRAVSLTPTHYGRNVMLASMAILLVILLVLARGPQDSSALGIIWDWCLCAQLIALAVWLSVRRWGLR